MIQFDEHIFRMGWFNHQLEKVVIIWNGCPVQQLQDFATQLEAVRCPQQKFGPADSLESLESCQLSLLCLFL